LLDGHERVFLWFGGVTLSCLYDNPRNLVLGRREPKVLWHPQFEDLVSYYGFTRRACQSYRARTKGKVESGVKYVKRKGWPPASFSSKTRRNSRRVSAAPHAATSAQLGMLAFSRGLIFEKVYQRPSGSLLSPVATFQGHAARHKNRMAPSAVLSTRHHESSVDRFGRRREHPQLREARRDYQIETSNCTDPRRYCRHARDRGFERERGNL
jgi:hypothetical protein